MKLSTPVLTVLLVVSYVTVSALACIGAAFMLGAAQGLVHVGDCRPCEP